MRLGQILINLKFHWFLVVSIFLFSSCYQEEVFYFPSGNLERINHYSDETGGSSDTYYYYNSNSNIAKEILKYGNEEVGETIYSYNQEGQLVEKEIHWPDKNVLEWFSYDEKGRLITFNSSRSSSYSCFYDNQNRLYLKKYYGGWDPPPQNEDLYFKDQLFLFDSVMIEKITDEIIIDLHYSEDSSMVEEHYKYIYNSEGQLEQKTLIDGKNFLSRTTKEFYVYDSKGRIFKKLTYNLNLLDSHYGLNTTETYYYFE